MAHETQNNPQTNSISTTNTHNWIPLNISVTHKIELEQVNLLHTDPIFNLIQENKNHFSKWLKRASKINTFEDTVQLINDAQEGYKKQNVVTYVIKYNQQIVGLIDLKNIDWNIKSAYFGYWIGLKASGKGIITLSCQTLISYIFNSLHWNMMKIRCAPENQKSVNVAKKLGFTYKETIKNAENINGFWLDHDVHVLERH